MLCFFCHLSIEKIIKAHVVKSTNEIPPKSHNLFLLSEKAKLQVSEDDELFFGVLMKYQLEGRYPDFNPATPNKSVVVGYLLKTKALLKCLIEKL